MPAVRARRIYTMDDENTVIDDGVIVFDAIGGKKTITRIGSYQQLKHDLDTEPEDLGDVTICPVLINAHTHLELSHLKEKLHYGDGFIPWAQSIIPVMEECLPNPSAINHAIAEMIATGTGYAADMSGSSCGMLYDCITPQDIDFILLVQYFGDFSRGKPLAENPYLDNLPNGFDSANVTSSAHAFYSVGGEVMKQVKESLSGSTHPFCLHLAESPEETELLQTGDGALADFFQTIGVLPQDFCAPGCSPVEYASQLGLLDKNTLAIHCVQLSDRDIEILADSKTSVCTCPRSNMLIGVGNAPLAKLQERGVNVAVGTDGYSSNHDLNLWNELRMIRESEPGFRVFDLIAMASRNGAKALNIDSDYGILEPGKIAKWAIVPEDFIVN